MSYVQGTQVRLEGDFSEAVTPFGFINPAEVVITIEPPTGAVFQVTRSGGQVILDPERAGRFYYVLDTSPEPGTWRYQFAAPGSAAVLKHKEITVRKALPTP